MGDIFAIGDIHGCIDQLEILIDKIDINFDSDTLVFLGDYIDRGPASYEVVTFLIELKERYSNTVFLRGNHEQMLAKYLSGVDRYLYLSNGGRQTIDSYVKNGYEFGKELFPEEHIDFFNTLDLFYQTKDYIFVHAGLRDGVPLEEQSSGDLLWIRQQFIKSSYNFGQKVVFGHTPLAEPLVQPNKIGIDTGAVYGNKLTCVRLPDEVFFNSKPLIT